ncbi:MAG: ferritin family protein [Candidatus Brocadiaceae bacterium]|nr:ferritin family protein [Candidatus Brocadiaceae bacterium]
MELKELLVAAIAREAAAHDLYAAAAAAARDPGVKALLTDLAHEEARHQEMLEALDADHLISFQPETPRDAGLADSMESKPFSPQAGLQATMAHAMRKELEARDFYAQMAATVGEPSAAALFRKLAAMEAGHKARLEEQYEATFLREN